MTTSVIESDKDSFSTGLQGQQRYEAAKKSYPKFKCPCLFIPALPEKPLLRVVLQALEIGRSKRQKLVHQQVES